MYDTDAELLKDIMEARAGLRSACTRLWVKLGDHARKPFIDSSIGYIALERAVKLYNPAKAGTKAQRNHFVAYYRQWCAKMAQDERLALDYPVRVTQHAMQQERKARKLEAQGKDPGSLYRLPMAVSSETLDYSSSEATDGETEGMDRGTD
jgi:acyl-homoserine lactone acylase PvdQ